ncbi:MAG TPA: hypothetical protein VK420_14765 [Longimicrobium sp.]|nr:hypothetical protein [Longimicrobium sp.]
MSLGAANAFARLRENAFHVLGLSPSCTRQEVEREGQKLLAMLELGLAEAARYHTPLGPVPRTPESVRAAMAALRDPSERLLHELWAQLPPDTAPRAEATAATPVAPWAEASVLLGWGKG